VVVALLLVTLAMFAFGYALVPIYRAVCSALGLNVLALTEEQSGAGAAAARNSQVDTSRTITVEFDANARGPWDFKPEQAFVDVHPGQITTVMYSFHNRQNRAMTVQAIPSYAPSVAMAHFTKLECFCFSQQVLQAGESKRWPVVFVVDAKLPRDVKTITLSYTFFEVGGKVPPEPVAAAQRAARALS
jgi:cytochrome c oxidase assembly protein subunit 11